MPTKKKGHSCPKCKKFREPDSYIEGQAGCMNCRRVAWKRYVSTKKGRERHLEAQKRYLMTPKGRKATKRAYARLKVRRQEASAKA